MRLSVVRLGNSLKELFSKTNTQGYDIGALQGVLTSPNTVKISGKSYTAVFATDISNETGSYVWCQLASSDTAVIIGG